LIDPLVTVAGNASGLELHQLNPPLVRVMMITNSKSGRTSKIAIRQIDSLPEIGRQICPGQRSATCFGALWIPVTGGCLKRQVRRPVTMTSFLLCLDVDNPPPKVIVPRLLNLIVGHSSRFFEKSCRCLSLSSSQFRLQ
jgi:hypothetical protein